MYWTYALKTSLRERAGQRSFLLLNLFRTSHLFLASSDERKKQSENSKIPVQKFTCIIDSDLKCWPNVLMYCDLTTLEAERGPKNWLFLRFIRREWIHLKSANNYGTQKEMKKWSSLMYTAQRQGHPELSYYLIWLEHNCKTVAWSNAQLWCHEQKAAEVGHRSHKFTTVTAVAQCSSGVWTCDSKKSYEVNVQWSSNLGW